MKVECRIYNVYAENIVQFNKIIELSFIPNEKMNLKIDDKFFLVKHVIVNYDSSKKSETIDVFVEINKNSKIEALIDLKNRILPTHLISQDKIDVLRRNSEK